MSWQPALTWPAFDSYLSGTKGFLCVCFMHDSVAGWDEMVNGSHHLRSDGGRPAIRISSAHGAAILPPQVLGKQCAAHE